MVGNKIKMKIKINKKINEMSAVSGGMVSGHVDDRNDLEETLIDESYFSSGALANSGGHYDRSKEGHERYVRMRFINQGLQNFKQNRYFAENKSEERKIRIKIRKNLEERCQKGYKTHKKRKTKKMFGKRYRNCVKAE
jgi:hypothetical protein